MGRVQLNVWVEEAERDRIKARAAEAGVPVGRLVAEAVLGSTVEPQADLQARGLAEEALQRAEGARSALDMMDRRLCRLEEMAGI